MKRKTIRNHKDFFPTPDDPVERCFFFVIKTKKAEKKEGRYGIVTSKRSFKLAVQRNRAKRLLRDWIAYNEEFLLPDQDYIFIAREPILDCPREIGRQKMRCLLKRISK